MEIGNAIEVKNVSKGFKVYMDKGNTIKEKIVSQKRRKYEKRQVLNDISFSVKCGEAIGLVGRNGCGKSTTLKLLTRIMYPDKGTIEMKGRVSSLIELGAGFHPDMSGRENIYINASIFGLTKKEIDDKLDDIITFSELEEYIDNPVRTYSSGMYMRLAFSVAINVNADIILIDEILAVGDANFQAKCFNRLRELKGEGKTIVIVSHSLSQIEQICERSIWLENGLIREVGRPDEVHPLYLEFMGEKRKEVKNIRNKEKVEKEQRSELLAIEHPKEQENKKFAKVTSVSLCDTEGNVIKHIKSGETVDLCVEYESIPDKLDEPLLGILIFRNDGVQSYGTNTQIEHIKLSLKQQGKIVCKIEKLNLIAGEYWIDIAIRNSDMFAHDYCSKGFTFTVYATVPEVGIAKLDHSWEFM